jgi:hypothetical protein
LTETPPHTPRIDRIGGGGAATSAGIRFEQQLGALISAWILAGDRFDASFGLGAAAPVWLRFETEAPIDDLLVKTTNGGFVAIQAKTTASLSDDLGSPLGKTVSQFVRHWVVCQQGDGSMEWNRPLDAGRDRLVLAVGAQATAQVREDLPAALRLKSQPGGGALNQAQQRAFETFASLVERAWGVTTKGEMDDRLLADLARLVTVFTFDVDRGPALSAGSLVKAFGADADGANAFALLSDVSGAMMRERGGGDLPTLRLRLAAVGVTLAASPAFRVDIEALKQHSRRIAEALGSYEKIEVASGESLTVRRECQGAVEAAVRGGPLLVIGEPGAGKSAVLNALARGLVAAGADVLELAVDRYSVETLEGLSRDLGLQHGLLEVLEAWDGPEPAYLLIDALDATRGGRGEGVFRVLIERVMELGGRWTVVASIRNFDLRMGQQFRALFKGVPPERTLADPAFGAVRHLQVPEWSSGEFEQLLQQSPELQACLDQAPPRLRELAMVPFNTRLLSELIARGAVSALGDVSSQADLLRLYWDHRVGGHGLPAMTCLHRVVQLMVEARALRAPILSAGGDAPAMIDTLCRDGVLIVVEDGRWVQFRHHLLFDYAAARLLLQPSAIVSGAFRFRKADALGLMLSPALGFVLREIWESATNRVQFWTALSVLINDEDGDPIIRSTAGRLGAEFPTDPNDGFWLCDRAVAGDAKARKTLSDVCGALAVRLEDERSIKLKPWAHLAERLATAPSAVVGTLRFLLHSLIDRLKDDPLQLMLGEAARAFMAHALTLAEPGGTVRSAIGFVIDTYPTDIPASRALLAELFVRDRLDRFGHEEVPAVCYKIAAVGAADPDFVVEIFRVVFEYQVNDDRQTRIGNSEILNLTSNARQDYGMARWSLGKYLPNFLAHHPQHAVRAIVNAVEGYIAREHRDFGEALDIELEIAGQTVRLREDQSYVWAHNPDDQYDLDAESLVLKLRLYINEVTESEAKRIADLLIEGASRAIFWSRLFLCAVERADSLVDQLWPFAATEPFLVLPDTRKDAIDVVAAGFCRRSHEEREAFERNALHFDFVRFQYPEEARRAFLERLFTAVGYENLVTETARQIVVDKPEAGSATNERLFVIHSHVGAAADFHWIKGLDREALENSRLITAINAAKVLLRLDANPDETSAASLPEALVTLDAIKAALVADSPHAGLRRHAEAIIGQGVHVIVSRRLLKYEDASPAADQEATFIALLTIAAQSENPDIDESTEARFEESASWGGPAARVEAAVAVFDLLPQRPDLFADLFPLAERFLTDIHPAVRLNAAVRLGRLWDIDRDRFWRLLADRLAHEPNLTVVEQVLSSLVARLIHDDQPRSLELLLALLQREAPGSDRAARLSKAVADKISALWVKYQSPEAKEVLEKWLSAPWRHAEEVRTILSTLRRAIVSGIGTTPDKDAGLRRRSQALISDVVEASNARLALLTPQRNLDEATLAEAQECARLINLAIMEMYFATGGAAERDSDPSLNQDSLAVFFRENASILMQIGEYAPPHTTYYLLQLVERLVDVDPAGAFDLAAHSLRGGRRSGYESESLGVDLLVRLVGVFLADHKSIFEVPTRRAALVDCLEVFLEAGWPAARRLLYRLPELIQ